MLCIISHNASHNSSEASMNRALTVLLPFYQNLVYAIPMYRLTALADNVIARDRA